MKKTIYIIMVLIQVLLTAACGNKSDKIQIPVEVVTDIAEYRVIRGENCTDEEKKAAVELHQSLYKVFDSIGIGTDYSKGTKEILVGVINIWKYIHDYFTNEYKLDNLIWCYAPNISENSIDIKKSPMNVMYLYPGDEYCDIVGVDWYSSGTLEITAGESYPKLISESGKIGAVTEFGPANNILAETFDKQPELYSCMDLYGDLYEISKNEISMAYILLWCGKHSAQALGNGTEFMNTDMTLGQTDVKALFDALK